MATTQDLLRKTNSAYNAQHKMVDTTKEEIAEYLQTPVTIHHESEEAGTVFSYNYRGVDYRYQLVDNELFGSFNKAEFDDMKADYVGAGLNWN